MRRRVRARVTVMVRVSMRMIFRVSMRMVVGVKMRVCVDSIALRNGHERLPTFLEPAPHLGGDGHEGELGAVGGSAGPPHVRFVQSCWHAVPAVVGRPLGHR